MWRGGGGISTGSYKPGISEAGLPATLSGGVEVYTTLHYCSLIYAITKLLFMPAQRDRRQRVLLQHQTFEFLFYLAGLAALHKASTI